MPRPAEGRSKSRRSKWSDWAPAGLLILGVCAIGVYVTQDAQSLEQLRHTLGFGSAPAAKESPDEANSQTSIQDSESPKSEEPIAESEEFVADRDGEDVSSRKFLPANRTHRHLGPRRNSAIAQADADLQLDSRFESEQTADGTADAVHTAELVKPIDGSHESTAGSQIKKDHRRLPQRNLFASDEPVEPEDSTDSELQLTAGDNAGSGSSRRPGRTNAQARPANANSNANSGVQSFDLTEVQKLIDQGQDVEAYQKLADAYSQLPSQRPLFQKQLDEVAQRIYFSPQSQLQPPHEIQPGDQLRKIAAKYQLSWQYLSRLNQVDARKIRPGKVLKVFQGPFEARIDLSDFQLTVMLSGQYVKRYQVGIGKMDTTPVGEFTVREKLENPTYYGPNGMVLEADDPQNPLGERWIDIGNSFGIHGTIEPDSIGKSESAGCVRMRNEDVAEVYDLLTVGSSVRIQR